MDALTYLQEHNSIYQDMVINHNMLETMLDEFILEGISSKVASMNQDFEEYERYAADLNTSNYENNLYHTFESVGIENVGFSSGCIYTYVNEIRQNLY